LEILHELDEMTQHKQPNQKLVLTVGAYDGVHVAHRALIAGVVMRAHEIGARAVVITFDPHPDLVIHPDKPLMLLTGLEEKATLIAEVGADFLVMQPFTTVFAQLSPEAFVQKMLQGGTVQEIHVGEDFRFGYKAQGNVALLREIGHNYGFQVKALAPLEIDGQVISSTLIRKLIVEGDVEQAARWLARGHSLKGEVVHGAERGRLLGFPTANLEAGPSFVVPGNGVYATVTTLAGEATLRPSVTNIGTRPTFDNGLRSVETFLLDFSGDLYGQIIKVEFVKKLRDEQRFAGLDAIKAQLALDVEHARLTLVAAGRS
jgi:riboflavin kinase/FMN adenylyltransferase